jgi:hypothetical protein
MIETFKFNEKKTGDPIARPPSNLTVRSEDDAYLQCPVAGYPIIKTAWQKDLVSIPSHSRHTLFDNGTLFIRSTQDTLDSGLYVCTKINEKGQSATGHLYLRIMSKPRFTRRHRLHDSEYNVVPTRYFVC